MGRNRFVSPETVRLYLVDVHRRAHAALLARPTLPTADELAQSAATVKEAEADGAFIDIKKELNAGERRRVFSDLVTDARSGERFVLDPHKVGLTKMLGYLLDWSFTDEKGQPVPVTEGAILSLDMDTFREINEAIDWHEDRQDAERAAKKLETTGTSASAAISASLA